MNIALVSSTNVPDWEVDDKLLVDALEKQGAKVQTHAWTDDVHWSNFDISIIRTTWDYHLHIETFLAWAETVPRLWNSAQIIKWNTHKSYLKELEQHGTPIAPTRWIQIEEKVDIKDVMKYLDAQSGFIKPQVGACASDTFRFNDSKFVEAQQFLNQRLHVDMMVQPYLKNVETEGELSAIFIDGKFTHGVQKIPVHGDYRVQDDFGAIDMPYSFTKSEVNQMEEVLHGVPQNNTLLYARLDWLRSDEGNLLLNELELVEPSLFFRHCKDSATQFANAIIRRAMME